MDTTTRRPPRRERAPVSPRTVLALGVLCTAAGLAGYLLLLPVGVLLVTAGVVSAYRDG